MVKLMAKYLAERLRVIDDKEWSSLQDDESPDLAGNRAKRLAWTKEVMQEGLKLISLPVADGRAYYYEDQRTQTEVTFVWFYGGPDGYVSDLGEIISIPIERADKLIESFKPEHIL